MAMMKFECTNDSKGELAATMLRLYLWGEVQAAAVARDKVSEFVEEFAEKHTGLWLSINSPSLGKLNIERLVFDGVVEWIPNAMLVAMGDEVKEHG